MNLDVIWNNLSYFLLGSWPDGPVGGAFLTMLLSIVSALASGILGLLFGILLSATKGFGHNFLLVLLSFFRAVPIIMLIFWTYFLLPIFLGWNVPGNATVVVALSLVTGSYLAHSVYAGICSLPKGQWQAGAALGFSKWQVLRLVVLPQALPMMAPSFINQWVSLVKDTSLAYVIGVGELSFVATQVSNREMVFPAEIFLFVALIYLVFCYSLESLAKHVASKFRRSFA
jgi:polar amino acid transport system permease protein